MTDPIEVSILGVVLSALKGIDGTGSYSTDLGGRVHEVDLGKEPNFVVTPVVTVSFANIDPGSTPNAREMAVQVDCVVNADYAAKLGVAVQSALLLVHRDIERAMAVARDTTVDNVPVAQNLVFAGTARPDPDDASGENGFIQIWRVRYSTEAPGW